MKYFQQIKLLILPCCCSCQPMELLSNLSSQVLVIIIKSQEKIKPVFFFLIFNLNSQNFAVCKNPDFFVKFQQYAQST